MSDNVNYYFLFSFMEINIYLYITIFLGFFFLFLQFFEYLYSSFDISDSSYGTIFFALTGLHGIHVIFGLIMIISCLIRHNFFYFSEDSINILFAIWY